jgi:RNA polymerase sigma factor (sigma-70 family)
MPEIEAGFAARVAENQRRVFHIAYSVLGNAADAEEIVQEAFLSAYKNFHALRDSGRFRAWVNRIAFRLALNRQRDARRRIVRDTSWHATVPETTNTAGEMEQRLLLEQLRAAIQELPENCAWSCSFPWSRTWTRTRLGPCWGFPPVRFARVCTRQRNFCWKQ